MLFVQIPNLHPQTGMRNRIPDPMDIRNGQVVRFQDNEPAQNRLSVTSGVLDFKYALFFAFHTSD